MEITEIKIFPVKEERLKAYVSITLDNCFVVKDLKVIDGKTGLFVAMPSKKLKDGSHKDVAHPIDNDFRMKLDNLVLDAYEAELARAPKSQEKQEGPQEEKKIGALDQPQHPGVPLDINPDDYKAGDD